jgi:ABC-type transport system substrate-binding protein
MPLDEHELRRWVRAVATGKDSRRHFPRTMLGLGLSGPCVAHLLSTEIPAAEAGEHATPSAFTPSRRGGGGRVCLLWWQAPTIPNAHPSSGLKDIDALRVVYEPWAGFNCHGEFVPILAAEISSFAHGGLSPDGTAVTWRLMQGVVCHDGQPFTAADGVFTWEYGADSATTAVTTGSYQNIVRIDKLDRPPVISSIARSAFSPPTCAGNSICKRPPNCSTRPAGDVAAMKLMYQTSMNPVRQKDASDYQEAFEQTGMEVELKAVNPRIFFSSDPGNADAYAKFHAALQMFTVSPGSSDPQAHMTQSVSWEVARKANNWASQNVVRWGTPHTIGSGIRPRWS